MVILLAMLCIGGMELLFCRIADPELFDRIVTPAVSRIQTTWHHTAAAVGTKAAEAKRLAAALTAKPQAPKTIVHDPIPTGAAEHVPARDVFAGGNVDMVFYAQSDPVWASQPYGTDDIGKYGCGPTVLSMIISSMTVYDVNPAQAAAWAVEHGYWAPGDGSYHAIIADGAQAYGLHAEAMASRDAETLRSTLASGGIVVALMGPGHFTDNGHFIILRGLREDGSILVADPNNRDNNFYNWDAQLITDQLANRQTVLWHITV